MIFKSAEAAADAHREGGEFVLYNGDCRDLLAALQTGSTSLLLSSPPYFMGKSYDRSYAVDDFYADMNAISEDCVRAVEDGGSICWQVGMHVKAGVMLPLDFAMYEVFSRLSGLFLRNRIIWHFGHGTHAKHRFSGRHETLLWFTKGQDYFFDLDAVRVAQKYPGKRHYKGPNKGEYSGNPLGKNPSDVWEIPNVNSNHIEKTGHPCQFPVALAQRVIRALCRPGETVLDPFAGSGSAGIAAIIEGRRFIGAEMSADYCEIAEQRYRSFREKTLRYRPLEREISEPNPSSAVAMRPEHFSHT